MITWHSISIVEKKKDLEDNQEDLRAQKNDKAGNPVLRYLQSQAAAGSNFLQWDYRLQRQADACDRTTEENGEE